MASAPITSSPVPSSVSDASDSTSSIEIITDSFCIASIHEQMSALGSTKAIEHRKRRREAIESQNSLLTPVQDGNYTRNVNSEELKTTPLFSAVVQYEVEDLDVESEGSAIKKLTFPQYGLLAARIGTSQEIGPELSSSREISDSDRLFLNVNTPWSAFICGSQGSGKSHTLSCMLENCLKESPVGELPNPLAVMVFHYDKFTSFSSGQLCEAAYLCSAGIPVRILVSPSNYTAMLHMYSNLPGLSARSPRPRVVPMLLREEHLNIQRMKSLMAVNEKDGPLPLYMECVSRILRQMAKESKSDSGLNYAAFKKNLIQEGFSDKQNMPLRLRLELLESFMELPPIPGSIKSVKKASNTTEDIWNFEPGSLTIVDLSCPFVDDGDACALFDICLALFLGKRGNTDHGGAVPRKVDRVVALDEAHKFMTSTAAATAFTESLLSVIRLQRHLAARIIVATQEPTISPKLLDLSSMTIVHRFTSPDWLKALSSHLAGASTTGADEGRNTQEIFRKIVTLQAGEALLFSPSAMLDVSDKMDAEGQVRQIVRKLGMEYVKIRVRRRITADGGRSIMAV